MHELYGGNEVGVVRYDGDPDAFVALVWAWMIDNDMPHRPIKPPEPRWWRCQPGSPDGTWSLWGAPSKARGAFYGATIELGHFLGDLCVDEDGERYPGHDWTPWRTSATPGRRMRHCHNCSKYEVGPLTTVELPAGDQ